MNDIDFANKRRIRVAWSIVFVANLPVTPLLLAEMVTDWGARAGMMLAGMVLITPLYLLGLESCRTLPGLGSVLITGGAFVVLSQLWPVPHVFAVVWSADICNGGLTDGTQATGFFGGGGPVTVGPLVGSLVVLLTAVFLLVMAIVVGSFLNGIILISKMLPVREPAHRPTKLTLWRNGRGFDGRAEFEPSLDDETSD